MRQLDNAERAALAEALPGVPAEEATRTVRGAQTVLRVATRRMLTACSWWMARNGGRP